MPDHAEVVVVGAGAAGLAAAIFAARRMPGRTILAVDGAHRLGAKILVSGGGRCNVTNRVVLPEDFNSSSRPVVRRVLAAFPAERAVAFFREIGVELNEEEGGKLFPVTNRARTVLDALLAEAQRCGVSFLTGHRVTAIESGPAGLVVSTGEQRVTAARVVWATGGQSLPKTGSDGLGYELVRRLGHSLVLPVPALVPFVLDGSFHAPLSGIAHEVDIGVRADGVEPAHARGAMLWTHFGVSGPAVLNASRHWHRARQEGRLVTVTANLFPGDDFAAAETRLLELAARQPRLMLRNALATWLPTRVAEAVLGSLGITGRIPLGHLARDVRRRLLHALLDWPLPVRDSRGYNYAEVTAGGVPLQEIDPATMASRRCAGLHLVGEILDVDGRIGGFNFQWAWSSAWVAAAGLQKALASGTGSLLPA